VSSTATVDDMIAVLENPVAQSVIGPLLRLGPIYETDRLAVLMAKAARQSGWHVLTRQMGQTFVQDIAGPDDAVPWPSASRRRKVRRLTGQLQNQGPVTMRIVRGAAWSRQAFADLASIEANSWVGKRTDRSGAKFLNPDMLAHWQRAVVDPVIAQMLAAAILYVGDRPIAFSLDLTAGALQYGIASSYDEAFAAYSPGQIITVHAIDDSIARGVRQIDWGAGDSGYKQALGAKPGALIHDLLIVRHASLAAALRPRWEESIESGTRALAAGLADAMKTTLLPGGLTLKHLLLTGLALSAAASAFTE
jgi:CelD/BcsL family acetyltransferase involved in cellulose biosynthesis